VGNLKFLTSIDGAADGEGAVFVDERVVLRECNTPAVREALALVASYLASGAYYPLTELSLRETLYPVHVVRVQVAVSGLNGAMFAERIGEKVQDVVFAVCRGEGVKEAIERIFDIEVRVSGGETYTLGEPLGRPNPNQQGE